MKTSHHKGDTSLVQTTWHYDGTDGSATLNCYGTPEHFTFKVNGDKLTVNFEGEEIVHTRAAYQDPSDAPGDDPGTPDMQSI